VAGAEHQGGSAADSASEGAREVVDGPKIGS
jgi:hypothetical protein